MGRLWCHGHRSTPTFQIWLDLATRDGGEAEEHLKAVLVTLGDRHLPCLTHWGLWLLGHGREKPEYGQVRSCHSRCGKGYGGSIWGRGSGKGRWASRIPVFSGCHKAMGTSAGRQQVMVSAPQVGRVQVPTRRSRPSFLGPGRVSGLE